MPLNIIRADITKVKADAIVNTANPLVAIGAGVDRAIYEAAGAEQLLAEREKIGPTNPGQAAATPAFNLDAEYIIHTVGPAWMGGDHGEREAVASCYKESLRIAEELECESIAFPLISTGTYGFPKDEALQIAIREISSFLFEQDEDHDMNVYMVVYDKESFVISGKAFAGVQSYIEERDVKVRKFDSARRRRTTTTNWGYMKELFRERSDMEVPSSVSMLVEEELSEAEDTPDMMAFGPEEEVLEAPSVAHPFDLGGMATQSIEDIIDVQTETFQEMLFRHIDRRGLKDPDVYKRANLDRKLFSKIRSDVNYNPKKKTAIALAIALQLNLDETLDLIGRAGYTLSPASVFDQIVIYCITHKIYDIIEINFILFKYTDQYLS